ncbi:uncharacterized protein [Clytia hemisphaerica]|uniref:uncharacterized protein n=1 Tax=Clytia hemisphaerica TaxID=252671 RepID=UPI0034D7873C
MLRITLLALSCLACCVRATSTYGDGSVNAAFEVACDDTTMTISFNKTELDARSVSGVSERPYTITFAGTTTANCTTDKDGTVIGDNLILSANYPDDCGLVQTQETEYIQYSTVITIAYGRVSANPSISRMEYDNYTVSCKLNRTLDTKLSGDFYNVTHRLDGSDSGESEGTFNLTLNHYAKGTGLRQDVYKVGDLITFQQDFYGPDVLKAVIQKCKATSDGASAHEYLLIDDKCSADPGTSVSSNTRNQIKFDVEAFRFLSPDKNQVYIECSSEICLVGDVSGACASCNPFGRRKRRAVAEEESQVPSQRKRIVRSSMFTVERNSEETAINDVKSNKDGSHHDVIITSWQGILIIALLTVIVVVKFVEIITRKYRKTKESGIEYERVTENETV